MKRLVAFLAVSAAVASLAVAGCGSAAAPVQPSPQPTKVAAEPTKAAAVQSTASSPTAVPAQKVDYPTKGKSINMIVPYAAGGATDVAARLLAGIIEKDLGAPMPVVNKPGAGSQVGVTELSVAKPDGYTIGNVAFPAAITSYLDPERKATFNRKSFEPIGKYFSNPVVVSVLADSPYKSFQDLIDAAKAKPGQIKAGTTGLLGPSHLALLQLQQMAGIQLAIVHFDGGNPQMTALLGGHINVGLNTTPEVMSPFKSNKIRPLAVMAKNESKFLPGVKTLESLGYKLTAESPVGLAAPAGTSKEIVDILSKAMKKAVEDPQFKAKMDEMASEIVYLTPEQYAADWAEKEETIRPLIDLAKKEATNK